MFVLVVPFDIDSSSGPEQPRICLKLQRLRQQQEELLSKQRWHLSPLSLCEEAIFFPSRILPGRCSAGRTRSFINPSRLISSLSQRVSVGGPGQHKTIGGLLDCSVAPYPEQLTSLLVPPDTVTFGFFDTHKKTHVQRS